jgi:hypothetical protein
MTIDVTSLDSRRLSGAHATIALAALTTSTYTKVSSIPSSDRSDVARLVSCA